MKKLVSKICLIMTALIIPVKANTGFYIGAAIGGANLNGKNQLSLLRNNNVSSFTTQMSNTDVHVEALAGYGQFVDSIWLGIESHVGVSPLEAQAFLDASGINSRQKLNVKSYHKAGMDFHIGYALHPKSKAYIKLGGEVRKFSHDFNATNQHGDPVANHNKSYYSGAFVSGLGVETEVSPQITIRSEYKVAIHPEKSLATSINTSKTTLKTRPHVHHFMISFIHKI